MAAFAFLMLYAHLDTMAWRNDRVIIGRVVLKHAQQQLSQSGRVEPNGSWHPFVFTNDATVDGATYRCSVATPLVGFEDEGILAMTTNEMFIWIDKKRAPKAIPAAGYRPSFFSEGF